MKEVKFYEKDFELDCLPCLVGRLFCPAAAAAHLLRAPLRLTAAAPAQRTAASSDASQAEDFSGTITINTQAGQGATEAWQAVADAYMEMHPNVNVVVDLKAAEGYAEWIKAMFASDNPEADLVNINMAGPDSSGKAINYMEYAYNDSPYSDGAWNEQFEFRVQGREPGHQHLELLVPGVRSGTVVL